MESRRASPSLAEDKSTGKSGQRECAHSCERLTGATSLGPCLGNYEVPQLALHSETQSQTLRKQLVWMEPSRARCCPLLNSDDRHFREAAKGWWPGAHQGDTICASRGQIWVVLAPATGHERLLSQVSRGADTQVWTML